MKTLCVAVVVLSLTSVCQSAPLTCEQLNKPLDKSPDLSGRWYMIALSSDVCLIPSLLNALFWPSLVIDFKEQDTPNLYNANVTFNMHDFCDSKVETFFLKSSSLFDVDSNNSPTGEPDTLLHTGCPDCLVIKGNDGINLLMYFSRRKTVTDAELKEFETQSECMGWFKPEVLNTVHEYQECKSLDDDNEDFSTLTAKMGQRMKSSYTGPLQCIAQDIFYYPRVAFEWIQERFYSLL
ncbi:uncharacterized protein LOC114856059 [Betta splendens]|uniref:Uncharacterized protein LOC114856059 n=1 Tax=Betta splendens TaxID=158456 RepID=A0A6P7MM54_BETSP|nr:uncharacterized protein LOC114856059 [Betta splendens]